MSDFLTSNPNLRSAIRVFVYAFLGTFVPAAIGWLGNVAEWTTDGTAFPSVDILGKAAVAAFVGALSGAIAFAYNKLPIGATSTYEEN